MATLHPDATTTILKTLTPEEVDFLLAVVEEGVLKPSFDFVRDLHFPKLNGRTMEDLRDVVGSLISKGLISETRADKLIACPHCGSRLILTYYTCPYCHSRNVSKENLYEHLVCGAISRESAVRVDDKLVCQSVSVNLKSWAGIITSSALGLSARTVGGRSRPP